MYMVDRQIIQLQNCELRTYIHTCMLYMHTLRTALTTNTYFAFGYPTHLY